VTTAGNDFDRDVPLKPLVAGPIHFAHAAGANQRGDRVGPDARTGLERQQMRL
jgi:hypothetical protein